MGEQRAKDALSLVMSARQHPGVDDQPRPTPFSQLRLLHLDLGLLVIARTFLSLWTAVEIEGLSKPTEDQSHTRVSREEI